MNSRKASVLISIVFWIVATIASGLASETADVTLKRDVWGVPHIFAATLADGAYGLGYAQAEDTKIRKIAG